MVKPGRPRAFDTPAALDAACQVFWRRGGQGATYAELVSATGVNPPSLYAAFGDKDALQATALERYFALYGEPALTRLEASGGTARAAVRTWLAEIARSLSCPRGARGCLVVRTLGETSGSGKAGRAAALVVRRLEAGVRRRFRRALLEGDLGPRTDAAALARAITAGYLGLALQAQQGAGRARLLAAAEALATLVPQHRTRALARKRTRP